MPIIRLEVEGMKHSILTALSRHSVEMDSMVQGAVEAFCTSEHINNIVKSEVNLQLELAVKAEVRSFFQYSGAGRKAVYEAVTKHLEDNFL